MPRSNTPIVLFVCFVILSLSMDANARYAAIVIDAESGRVIHENEAAHRWYPASLTKVMTIYLTFQALRAGELDLHQQLTVSPHAARQPNSRIGLRTGQKISVADAIMAVTTRSANDAAVLLAETIGGSETQFAHKMTHQAKLLGMSSSSFANASGLPDEGQISSARDLAILALALLRDFPQYYPYFSATEFVYKGRVLPNTNKILKTYPDADGMKTGFTCGSGYNLIASAKRNGHRVIGVLLGAHSSGERFAQMAELLDLGFDKFYTTGNAEHIFQLKADNYSPPPFQLSSNRCAGSAEQMGAEVSNTHHEAIDINPAVSYHYVAPENNQTSSTPSNCGYRHGKRRTCPHPQLVLAKSHSTGKHNQPGSTVATTKHSTVKHAANHAVASKITHPHPPAKPAAVSKKASHTVSKAPSAPQPHHKEKH